MGRTMRTLALAAALWAGGCGPGDVEECLPSTGDNCSCDAQCLTPSEIDEAQKDGVCDLGCGTPDWKCARTEAGCEVVIPVEAR